MSEDICTSFFLFRREEHMKVLIVSDTHSKHAGIEEAICREKPFDLLIHLGDIEGYEDYIQSLAECPIEVVKGNMDRNMELPRDKEIIIENMHVLITHGHCHGVNTTLERIQTLGLQKGVDVVMFGHTHMPLLLEDRMITLLNPGSISYPRQKNKRLSYIVMDKEKGGKAHFEIRYL